MLPERTVDVDHLHPVTDRLLLDPGDARQCHLVLLQFRQTYGFDTDEGVLALHSLEDLVCLVGVLESPKGTGDLDTGVVLLRDLRHQDIDEFRNGLLVVGDLQQ